MAAIELGTLPLLQPDSEVGFHSQGALNQHFIRRVLEGETPPQESSIRAVARRIIKAIPPVLTVWGNYYFIPVNNAAAGNSLPLKIILNYGNAASCISLNTWASWQLIDQFIGKETALNGGHLSTTTQSGLLLLSVVVGGLAQFAVADVASLYNDGGILPAAIVLLSDGPVPMCSTWLTLQKIVSSCTRNAFEKRLSAMRDRAVEELNTARFNWIRKPQEQQVEALERFAELKAHARGDVDDPRDILTLKNELLELMFSIDQHEEGEVPCIQGVGERIVFGTGILLSVAHLGLFAKIAYTAGVKAGGSELGYSLATLVVSASFYLNMLSVSHTGKDLFSDTADFFRGAYVPSIPERLRPGLTLCLKAFGLLTTALSYGGSIGMADEAFDDEVLQKVFGISVSIAFALFTYTSFAALSEEGVESRILHHGSDEEKRMVEYDIFMKQSIEMLEKASPKEVASFLRSLPDDIYDRVVDDEQEEFDDLLARFATA